MAEDPKRDAVTAAHLRESQRSLILMFRSKGFPVAWVNRNAIDLLAQANVEYMEWLERHEPEQSPVGWLVTCAYRRGLNLLTSQGRGPGSTSIDAVFGLADESTPTPEQQALDDDRQRRLRKALGCLPQRERKLLSLVYFEDCSVREAGRRLGWRKSAADRHHRDALERLRALVDPSLLSPASLGLAAWVALQGDGSRRWAAVARAPLSHAQEGAVAALEGARSIGHRLGETARKLIPLTDPAALAAFGGVGRVAGACGAAALAMACALLVVGGGSGDDASHRLPPAPLPEITTASEPSRPAPSPAPVARAVKRPAAKESTPPRVDRSIPPPGAARAERESGAGEAVEVHQATHQNVEEEFGIEEESSPAVEPTPPPAPPPEEPKTVAPPARTAGKAPPASGAQVESEFGL